MSAFMVSDAHIDVLIDCAKQFARASRHELRWHFGNPSTWNALRDGENETEVGRMLLGENARSVAHRYREAQDPAALTYVYHATGRAQYSPGEALKTLGCFSYQACECDDWAQTEAHAFCEALKDMILHVAVPYPDGTPWGWDEEHLNRSAQVRLV